MFRMNCLLRNGSWLWSWRTFSKYSKVHDWWMFELSCFILSEVLIAGRGFVGRKRFIILEPHRHLLYADFWNAKYYFVRREVPIIWWYSWDSLRDASMSKSNNAAILQDAITAGKKLRITVRIFYWNMFCPSCFSISVYKFFLRCFEMINNNLQLFCCEIQI